MNMRIIILVMVLLSFGVHASPPDNRPPDRGNDDVRTDNNVDVNSETDVSVTNEPSANVSGIAGGDGHSTNTISTSSESRSIYLGAARDTAECFTKVTIGADVFGIGFSRSDPFCKKIRLIVRQLDAGNYDAAARLECTLPEWREVFGKDDQLCFKSLLVGDDAPTADVLMAQVEEEEFEELQKVVVMQADEIEHLREQVEQAEANEEEIERLRRQQAEDDARRELVRQRILEKRAKQEAEESNDGN
jgi:hypothetical protein